MSGTQPRFTGRKRRLKTPWSVRFSDVLSEGVITVGGIGTIVAVCLVALVLVMEVVPLFRSATVQLLSERETPWREGQIVHFELNEYQTMGWLLTRDGVLQTVRLTPPSEEGKGTEGSAGGASFDVVQEIKLDTGAEITAVSTSTGKSDIVLGLADGTVRIGDFRFETTFVDPIEIKDWFTEQAHGLSSAKLKSPGDTAIFKDGVVQMTSQGQYRVQKLAWSLDDPIEVSGAPIALLDHLPQNNNSSGIGPQENVFVVLTGDKQLKLGVVTEKKSLLTGKVKRSSEIYDLPAADHVNEPAFVLLAGLGNNVLAADADGNLARFSIRDYDDIQLAEQVDLLPDSDAKLTRCDWVLGRETLFCGDSEGKCSGWFQIRLADRQDDAFAERKSSDGFALIQAHQFPAGPAAVSSFGASSRSRMFLVGYETGACSLFHMTTEKHVADLEPLGSDAVKLARIAPRDDGILLEAGGKMAHYALSPGFPDITLTSLFFPVWYEGYSEPLNMWQSSSSKIEDELKFSLFPLISGTFKATFYSMLFGSPIALLAAIYTSEFATRRTRTVVKPAVEMMASLPSVVLGFVAALVFAPIVEQIVPACLAAVFVVPFMVLLGGFLWQLLPQRISLRIQPYRLFFLVPMLFAGIYLAYLLGPAIERWLFLGDIKYWLVHPEKGSGLGGWLLILLPASALAMLALDSYGIAGYWRSRVALLPRSVFSLIGFGKFLALTLATLLLAVGVGSFFDFVGWDPRGTYIGEYDQRNSLIVGFVMGFAVIPIIYTIADDALSTVPAHLRSASLGCGATPWQTTLRIVIPTAMSGLFSALMIGFGRVTGETMIVLMAGGNTPIEDWNIFNGFRTLSTNIAIELPEAVQGSSHYRVLFLSALVLFLLTFLINTVAEVVRLYFRRRAVQL
ncbi:ABC transporter permease subunit [Bremerella cremea]|uniref:ABC transporter permease subunit n=1 Tax=Bremerella cremea TaxID=1031537 RepID=A0A368KXD3_9BACT|nr:ABC transporter permease subunit [Bremerella cremea]RCS53039.1 ABC transporter permease subunit [Bremerella cremea]